MENIQKNKDVPEIKKRGESRVQVKSDDQPRWKSVKLPVTRQAEQVQVDSAGRVVLPARFRRALGIKAGDPVTIALEDNMLRVRTIRSALEKARALMRKHNPNNVSLVDELIAERRAEATKE